MYHDFCICSSINGHLGCFYVLAIVNSAAMNNWIRVFQFWFPPSICLGVRLLGHMAVLFLVLIFSIFFLFFKLKFIYFNWRLITLQYCIGFAIHQHESATGGHVFPILNPPPTSLPIPSLWVIPVHQPRASCILHRTWTGDLSHLWYYTFSMPFSQIIPPSSSTTESKRLFCTAVSLLLSHIQGYCYHLSKFHIYALVYCIGVFLSGLLHSWYNRLQFHPPH